MASDREAAQRLGKALHALTQAVDGVWDARERGDQEALDFFRKSISCWCKSIAEHAAEIRIKEKATENQQ